MGVNPLFHNALILSIVESSKDEGIGIFNFIKLMISETNWILSPGERDFGPSPVCDYVKNFIDGKYSYPLYVQFSQIGTPKEKSKEIYRDCLVKIHEILLDQWEEVSWFDLITYLLFIQSNCHHKGSTNSSHLCRNADSFLNFFYKSKNGFNPMGKWERPGDTPIMEVISPSKKAEFRNQWWYEAFTRDRDSLLMFDDLAPNSSLGNRVTTGWTVRGFRNVFEGDLIPYGSVLNQLRTYYGLPRLSGDYGLGCISELNIEFKYEGKKKDEDDRKKEKENDEISDNFCSALLATIGFAISLQWMLRR